MDLATDSNATIGLSTQIVSAHRAKFGFNEIPEKRASNILRVAQKFWNLSAWMLEAIALLSWFLGRTTDFIVALSLLIVNALISVVQERRAEGVVESLRARLRVEARVLRDGVWQVLPARELVPGDVVRLRMGDFVPADSRILTGALLVDQSALTGESHAIEATTDAVVYSGSMVRRGEATCRVNATGRRTYFGKTIELVDIAKPRLHIENIVARLVRWLFLITGILALLFTAAAFSVSAPPADTAGMVLAILLGAVPVALPVMFTVSMAVGARELAKSGVLVTRASALEDAASMAVLCADKTGTLTQNKLHVHEIFPANDFNADEVLQYAALASKEENHDPIDIAILTRVRESHLSLPAAHVQKFIPFDPTRRHTAATLVLSGATTTVYKGAVDTILSITPLTEDAAQSVAYTVEDQAAHGFRSLAVALQRENASPRFVGFLTLFDAPRSDAAGLITQLAEEGVAVKMLTGDALPIATELGEALQLTSIISVKDPSLQTEDANGSEKIQHPAIERLVKNPHIGGLAEVFPADKFNVVKAYQEAGYIVGMTGDGVNDAPALRQAEVGIAVRNATDMAKGAASVVLTTDGLESILPLVREGRMVSQRILTWIVNKVSLTILKTAFVVFGFLLTGQFVIETLGIILVALISDFTKIALSTDRSHAPHTVETWNLKIPIKVGATLGVLLTIESLMALWVGFHSFNLKENPAVLTSFGFQLMLYFGLFTVFSVRERRRFWSSRPSRVMLLAGFFEAALGALVSIVGLPYFAAIPWTLTFFSISSTATVVFIFNDWVKARLYR